MLKIAKLPIFILISIASSASPAYADGYVEAISVAGSSFNIRGWACDPTRPDDIAGIHIYQNNLWLTGGNSPHSP